MADDAAPAHLQAAADDGLQFDRVVTGPATAVAKDRGVVCSACETAILTEYFDIGGHVVCDRCRHRLEMAAEPARGVLPLLVAGAWGLAAGIVGAIIYYSVIAIAHVEIGIVAILIGYMVGYAVRRGAGGRGGLRFQVLAVALTYMSVAFAYTPLVVQAARQRQAVDATAGSTMSSQGVTASPRAAGPPRARSASLSGERPGGLRLVAIVAAFVLTLPVVIVLGNLPFSLITLLIITIGMRQAFHMTAAPILEFRGPYRVGAPSAASA